MKNLAYKIKSARLRKTPVILVLIAALVVPAVVRANAEEEQPTPPVPEPAVMDSAHISYVDTNGISVTPVTPLGAAEGELGSPIIAADAPAVDGHAFVSVKINGDGTEDDVYSEGDDTIVYTYQLIDTSPPNPNDNTENETEEGDDLGTETENDETPADPEGDVSAFMAFANAEHEGDDTVASYAFIYKHGIKSLKVTYTDGFTVYVATGDFSTLKVVDNHRRIKKCQRRVMNHRAYFHWWKKYSSYNDFWRHYQQDPAAATDGIEAENGQTENTQAKTNGQAQVQGTSTQRSSDKQNKSNKKNKPSKQRQSSSSRSWNNWR